MGYPCIRSVVVAGGDRAKEGCRNVTGGTGGTGGTEGEDGVDAHARIAEADAVPHAGVLGALLGRGDLAPWLRVVLAAAVVFDGGALIDALAADGWSADWPSALLDRGYFAPRRRPVWFDFDAPIMPIAPIADGAGRPVVARCGALCQWQELWGDGAPLPEVTRVLGVRAEVRWLLRVSMYAPSGRRLLDVRCAVDAGGRVGRRTREEDPQLGLPPLAPFWIDDVLSRDSTRGALGIIRRARRAARARRTGALLLPVLLGLALLRHPGVAVAVAVTSTGAITDGTSEAKGRARAQRGQHRGRSPVRRDRLAFDREALRAYGWTGGAGGAGGTGGVGNS